MRGRINIPLHSVNDVVVVALLAAGLFAVAGWVLSGRTLTDFADLLRPRASATLLEIELVLAGAAAAVLAGTLPLKESAVPSVATEAARNTTSLLLGQRELWRFSVLRCTRVRELAGAAAWNAAWYAAQPAGTEKGELVMVRIVVLLLGGGFRPPRQLGAEEIAGVLRGVAAVRVPFLAAFGAVCLPASRTEP